MAADRRQEHAARAHAQDGRHVLDQRRHAAAVQALGVEAQELARPPRRRARRARETRAGVIGTNRWIVSTGEPIAGGELARYARCRRAPRRRAGRRARRRRSASATGRLGGDREPALGERRGATVDRARRSASSSATWRGGEAELEPAPRPARRGGRRSGQARARPSAAGWRLSQSTYSGAFASLAAARADGSLAWRGQAPASVALVLAGRQIPPGVSIGDAEPAARRAPARRRAAAASRRRSRASASRSSARSAAIDSSAATTSST